MHVAVRFSRESYERFQDVCADMGDADNKLRSIIRMYNMYVRMCSYEYDENDLRLRHGQQVLPFSPTELDEELRFLSPDKEQGIKLKPRRGGPPVIQHLALEFKLPAHSFTELLKFSRYLGVEEEDPAAALEEMSYQAIQFAEKMTMYRKRGWNIEMTERNTRRRKSLDWMYDPGQDKGLHEGHGGR